MKGQISVEYMLLMAAFLGAASLFFPAVQQINLMGSFALECQKANAFLDLLELRASEIKEYADGSCFGIAMQPSKEWLLSREGKKIILTVKKGEKSKSFERDIDANFLIAESAYAKYLSVRKENGVVSIVNGNC